MKYLRIILFFLITSTAFAQKCDRPEEVYIRLIVFDSTTVINCFGTPKTHIYLEDSTEVFVRISESKEIKASEYSEIQFHTINQLRKQESEIMRCEASHADGLVYLDVNINSVLKKIYMVMSCDEIFYKFQVHWIDAVE